MNPKQFRLICNNCNQETDHLVWSRNALRELADMERTMQSLGRRVVELDTLLEERNEADVHFLMQFCHALGLHKAQSVELALERIAELMKGQDVY